MNNKEPFKQQISKQFCNNNSGSSNGKNKKYSYFLNENNLIYSNNDSLIIYDNKGKKNINVVKCNGDINHFILNGSRTIGATSHYSPDTQTSIILIWDLQIVSSIKIISSINVTTKGYEEIMGLQFNLDSTKLIGIGSDDKSSIFLWDIKSKSIIISTPSTYRVTGVVFNPFSIHSLISFGEKHIHFWTFNETMISKKKAIFGKDLSTKVNITCCYIYSSDTCYFGTDDGNVLVFKNNNLIQLIKLSPPNNPKQSSINNISPYNNKDERLLIQQSIQQLLLLQQQLLQLQLQQQQANSNNGGSGNSNNITNTPSTITTNISSNNLVRKSGFFVTFENVIIYFSAEDSFKTPRPVSSLLSSSSISSSATGDSNEIIFIDSFDDKLVILDKNDKQFQTSIVNPFHQIGSTTLEPLQ